jgi:hypothetical protein
VISAGDHCRLPWQYGVSRSIHYKVQGPLTMLDGIVLNSIWCCSYNENASSFGSAVDALKIMTDVESPDSITAGKCMAILDFITYYLKSGNDLAQGEQHCFKTSTGAFTTLNNCIDYLPNLTLVLSTLEPFLSPS